MSQTHLNLNVNMLLNPTNTAPQREVVQRQYRGYSAPIVHGSSVRDHARKLMQSQRHLTMRAPRYGSSSSQSEAEGDNNNPAGESAQGNNRNNRGEQDAETTENETESVFKGNHGAGDEGGNESAENDEMASETCDSEEDVSKISV